MFRLGGATATGIARSWPVRCTLALAAIILIGFKAVTAPWGVLLAGFRGGFFFPASLVDAVPATGARFVLAVDAAVLALQPSLALGSGPASAGQTGTGRRFPTSSPLTHYMSCWIRCTPWPNTPSSGGVSTLSGSTL